MIRVSKSQNIGEEEQTQHTYPSTYMDRESDAICSEKPQISIILGSADTMMDDPM